MNYAGDFDFGLIGNPAEAAGTTTADSGAIVVEDAQLLFGGDYARHGSDLWLSRDGHDHVIADYFKGPLRKALSAPDGATLTPDIVKALVGEVQLAQAGNATGGAAQVIGTVSKLTGSATAIRNGVSVTLNVGDAVQKGDVVQAGADSALNLTFIDGTVFGLSANARMVLNEMVYDPQGSANSSLLSLVQGTITFVAGETAHNGNMRVDTPVATMGIRGTAVLVEIGFDVSGPGGVPVKFQVLVEPGGRVGNYVLYNKGTGAVMGTVNQAGQVTSVTGTGDMSVGVADPLTPIAQAIIQQTLQQYFPNYVPDANPRSIAPGSGSTPANPVPGSSNPDPIKFSPLPDAPVGVPTPLPINLPGIDIAAPPVIVTVLRFNSAPIVTVAPVVVVLPQNTNSFDIGKQVTITDPDAGDVATPYVPGTARIVTATGPSGTPTSLDLKTLITLDPQTGHVTYDPAAFKFLAAGQQAVYTIAFDSQSGPDTTHQTLTFTVDGSNDAPVIDTAQTVSDADAAVGGNAVTAQGTIAFDDADLGDSHTPSVTGSNTNVGNLSFGTVTAIAGLGSNGSVAWTYQADPDAVAAKLLASENGSFTESFTVTIDDGHGGTVTQTVSVTIAANVWTGGNEAGRFSTDAIQGPLASDWSDTSNWSLGTVPDGTQFVLFKQDADIRLDVPAAIGALIVGTGAHLTLTGSEGAQTLTVAHEFINDGNVTLSPGVTLQVSDAIHNQGQLTIDNYRAGASLLIDGHVTLDGGGTVTLDGTADRIAGFGNAVLTNTDNKIDGYGKIGDGSLSLINAAAGIIAATDVWHGITINTGSGTFTNDGLVVSASLFGGLEITGAVLNHGTLEAQLGLLKVDGAVTGHGTAVIDGGALEFVGASDAHVLFTGDTSDILRLDNVHQFTGTVTGFSFGDTIDLAGISARNVKLVDTGDGIEVHYGTGASDYFTITGDYNAKSFFITNDFHGGTAIMWAEEAPQIATDQVHMDQHGSTTTITGLSMFDNDAGCNETFSYAISANGQTLEHGSGKLGTIDAELHHGFSFQAAPGQTVGQVAVTVTDHDGASDTVNVIFATANATGTTPLALNGTAGKDVIIASSHDDTLTGGASADQFVFQTNAGQHVITDFTAGQDKIELDFAPAGTRAFQAWLSTHAEQQGADTLISFGGNAGSVLLKHVDVNELKASDFIHNESTPHGPVYHGDLLV